MDQQGNIIVNVIDLSSNITTYTALILSATLSLLISI